MASAVRSVFSCFTKACASAAVGAEGLGEQAASKAPHTAVATLFDRRRVGLRMLVSFWLRADARPVKG
jgi:hypothetical protein